MSKPYNGHRSWNAWNVALWIGNDEGLYHFALECVAKHGGNRRKAAKAFMQVMGGERTPDGAKYNATCVYEAMEGME